MKHESPIKRRQSRQIMVGNVPVGGDAPIAVQSMTNTNTCDVAATVGQIRALQDAGADIVRVSVPSMEAAEAFGKIRAQVSLPLVADIHFDHKIALRVAELGVDCLRINPGNIGRDDRVSAVIAMRHIDILDRHDFQDFKVSLKASEVFMTVAAYRKIAAQIEQPLHLGITEAGGFRSGTVKSSIGLGMLLMDGIGDTIRVSLAADPVQEIKVGYDILKSLRLRSRGINFIACPSCSRQNFDVIQTMNDLEARLEDVNTAMDVAIIGCIVNGPGEAKEADIGLTGGSPKNLFYMGGKPNQKLENATLTDDLERLIREEVARRKEQEEAIIARSVE